MNAFLAEDAELRARTIWADILNAAQFMRHHDVSPSITIHLTRAGPGVFEHFVAISGGTLYAYPAARDGEWQESVDARVGNVLITAIRSRPSTPEEEATR